MNTVHRTIPVPQTDLWRHWRSTSRATVSPSSRDLRERPQPNRRTHLRAIVVPLDGTHFAEHALPYAIGLAERSGAVLKLVHIHLPCEDMDPTEVLNSDSAQWQALKRQKQEYLLRLTNRIAAISSARVTTRLVTSSDLLAPLQGVIASHTDFVVMAHHARGLMSRLWSGSVAHSLLPKLKTPVMFVRGDDRPVQLAATAINHILIPLDGSREAESVIQPAVMLGEVFQAKHTLMQAVSLEPKHVIRHGALSTDWKPSKQRAADARSYLENVASDLRARSLDCRTRVVSDDVAVSEVIMSYSLATNADLIAIAPSVRGRFSRMIRGSTEQTLMRNAQAPLLLIPRNRLASGVP